MTSRNPWLELAKAIANAPASVIDAVAELTDPQRKIDRITLERSDNKQDDDSTK